MAIINSDFQSFIDDIVFYFPEDDHLHCVTETLANQMFSNFQTNLRKNLIEQQLDKVF